MQILQSHIQKAISFFDLNVDYLQNNITSLMEVGMINFVNNDNFKFWLQLQSRLMAAMNTGLNLYQAEYRID